MLIWYNPNDFTGIKIIYTTCKNIIWLKKNLKWYFFNIKITIYWIDLGQFKLTYQIYDLNFKTMITSYKANQNKLWSLILNQFNVKGWN
jgi:hypothetical protein